MNGAITVARLLAPISDGHFCERAPKPTHYPILREHVRHNQSAARDVLHLTEPNRFPSKLLDNGSRRFSGSPRQRPLRPRATYDVNSFLVCLGEGCTVSIEQAKIVIRNTTLSKTFPESVNLRPRDCDHSTFIIAHQSGLLAWLRAKRRSQMVRTFLPHRSQHERIYWPEAEAVAGCSPLGA